ncbi:MAG: glycosyltransferase family 2 protein [Gemmatimonadaceae bacterium]
MRPRRRLSTFPGGFLLPEVAVRARRKPRPNSWIVFLLLGALIPLQLAATVLLCARLARGYRRIGPVEPVAAPDLRTTVTALIATLNEADHIEACLCGLASEGDVLAEILVVDSSSTDGTRALVSAAAERDPRVRLLTDDALPPGWVGKPWALEHGLRYAQGEWILGLDADTEARPGLVGGVVGAAHRHSLDVVSFSPCFTGQTTPVLWLQPALLTTLVYRFGAAGDVGASPRRVMANGQCFLARRSILVEGGGFAAARHSFSDDVTLARHLAERGARVGFLDGSRLYSVRSYRSFAEVWREWGRSLDLKDSTSPTRQWADVLFLILVQGLPVPILIASAGYAYRGSFPPLFSWLTMLAVLLFLVRTFLLFPLRAAYDRIAWSYWLSPLADPFAVARIVMSTLRRQRTWRGRSYAS